MMKGLKRIFSAAFILFTINICSGQSFEGTLNLRNTSDQGMTFSLLTVKDNKTLRIIRADSVESVILIKDWNAGTSVLLRSKDGMKYGFKASTVQNDNPPKRDAGKESSHVIKETTGKTELIGTKICTKINFKSQYATSEAWVTKDIGVPLSKYFPEFLGPNTDPLLYDLRKEADKEGFVMKYQEKFNDLTKENSYELFLKEKEISDDVFNISPEYLILDEADVKRLSADAEKNPAAQKQLDDFTMLFGIR